MNNAKEMLILDETLDYLNEGIFTKKDPARKRILQKLCLNLNGFFLKNGIKCECNEVFGNYLKFSKSKTDGIIIGCRVYGYSDPKASSIRTAGLATFTTSAGSDNDAISALGAIGGATAAAYGDTVNGNIDSDAVQQAVALLLNNEDEATKCINKGISGGRIELDGIDVNIAGCKDRFNINMYYHHK